MKYIVRKVVGAGLKACVWPVWRAASFAVAVAFSPYIYVVALVLVWCVVVYRIFKGGTSEETSGGMAPVESFTYEGHKYIYNSWGMCHDEGGCPCRNGGKDGHDRKDKDEK